MTKKRILPFIIVVTIFSSLAIFAFQGYFTSDVHTPLQYIFPFRDDLILIKLDYTSKGTFVVRQNINAKVELFKNQDQLNEMDIKRIVVMFPDSYDFAIERDIFETGSIELSYNYETNHFEGEINSLQYVQPGEYNFSIMIYTDDDNIVIDSDPKLHIAPPEVLLEVENNNRILALTFLMVMFAVIMVMSVFISLRVKNVE